MACSLVNINVPPCSSPDFSDDELDQRIKSSTDISTDTNTDTKTDTDQYQHSTRLPPGMTRADVSKHAHTHTRMHTCCVTNHRQHICHQEYMILFTLDATSRVIWQRFSLFLHSFI